MKFLAPTAALVTFSSLTQILLTCILLYFIFGDFTFFGKHLNRFRAWNFLLDEIGTDLGLGTFDWRKCPVAILLTLSLFRFLNFQN